jgi:hypothetical protein
VQHPRFLAGLACLAIQRFIAPGTAGSSSRQQGQVKPVTGYGKLFTPAVFWLSMCTLNAQYPPEIRLQRRPVVLWENGLCHDFDETLVHFPLLRGIRLPNGRRHVTDLMARKEVDSSFDVQKDGCSHQLF